MKENLGRGRVSEGGAFGWGGWGWGRESSRGPNDLCISMCCHWSYADICRIILKFKEDTIATEALG